MSLVAEEEKATQEIVSLGFDSSNSSVQSANEAEERKGFMQDLNKFMIESNKPLSKLPIMGYKELDLFQLYKEVVSYGGFNEVVKNVGTWSKIWKRLGNFDPSITDSSFRLKKNYERYLLDYEYKRFPDHKLKGMEMERQSQLKRSSSLESFDSSPTVERKQKSSDLSPKMKAKKNKARRSYGDVAKDMSGSPKLPLVLGELVVENLGTIIPRPPYVTEKHVWPVGFASSRLFSSMSSPDKRVKYTSTIIDVGDKPQFVVTAEDDPSNPIISPTPSGAWRAVLKRVTGAIQEDNRKSVSVSGALRFGLAHPVVASLIRDLPNGHMAPSPIPSRKRKSSGSDDSSEDGEYEEPVSPKVAKREPRLATYEEYFSARDVQLTTREEMDDLENAVATLHSLRFCSAFA
jgi:hypothetical protein